MTEKQKIRHSIEIKVITMRTTVAIFLDPADTTRWMSTSMEHFVRVVARLNKHCVVRAIFCPMMSLSIGTSQTCLFHPKCSSAYRLMPVKTVVGIWKPLAELMVHKYGTYQTCKNQPVIGPKVLRDLCSGENSEGDSQTNKRQEYEVENDINWTSLNWVNIIWRRP